MNTNQMPKLSLIHPDKLAVETTIYSARPPTPPISKKRKVDLGDGNFDYITCESDRKMFENAWEAINLMEMWEYIAEYPNSFAFSGDARINYIIVKMEELGYDGHSGCSFGITMRYMQYLARNGAEKFKYLYLNE